MADSAAGVVAMAVDVMDGVEAAATDGTGGCCCCMNWANIALSSVRRRVASTSSFCWAST